MENEKWKCKGKLNFYDQSNPLAPHAHGLKLGKQGGIEDRAVNLKMDDPCSGFGSSANLLSA